MRLLVNCRCQYCCVSESGNIFRKAVIKGKHRPDVGSHSVTDFRIHFSGDGARQIDVDVKLIGMSVARRAAGLLQYARLRVSRRDKLFGMIATKGRWCAGRFWGRFRLSGTGRDKRSRGIRSESFFTSRQHLISVLSAHRAIERQSLLRIADSK